MSGYHNPHSNLPLWAQRVEPRPHGRVPRSSRALSHQASQGVGSKAGSQAQRILAAITQSRHDGMTRPELSIALNIPINAVCGRVGQLLKAGKIGEPIDMNQHSPRRMREGAHVLLAIQYMPHQRESA
jgi:hypothetical protein